MDSLGGMNARCTLDSLDLVELLIHLEKLGLAISDLQFSRLRPYLVLPYSLTWQLGSLLATVEVIAQEDFHVLGIHDSGNALVGNIEPRSRMGRGRRYRSLNLACREFISMVESSAND